MKSLTFVLLTGLLIGSTGCNHLLYGDGPLTPIAYNKARGFTKKPTTLSKGDKVIRPGGYYCYVQKPKPGVDTTNLPLPESSGCGPLMLYDPHPAYYLLLPAAFVGDVLLVPAYVGCGIVVFLSVGGGM